MKAERALRELASITGGQWGMVTTAQAAELGVTRLMLSRLAEAGHFERLAHGVYKDAGAPGSEFDALRAAWLSTEPRRLAEARVGGAANGVVVASSSAAFLHDVGDLWADRHQFVAPARRQSQREDIRFRQRSIEERDVTLVHGLPVMRLERTIADLLEDFGDLSLVADALSDALKKYSVDLARLSELLGPLAERNGFQKNDGAALLDQVTESAGLDLDSVARRLATNPALGARVASDYLRKLPIVDQSRLIRRLMAEMKLPAQVVTTELAEALQRVMQSQLDAASSVVPSRVASNLTKRLSGAVNVQAATNLAQYWEKNGASPSGLEGRRMLATSTALEGEVNDEAE